MELIKKLIPLILIISTLFSVVSCNNGKGDEGNTDPSRYTVTVLNPFGKPVSGVTVYVHKDGSEDYNICTLPALTDNNGTATFTLDPSGEYSVQLSGVPEVYSASLGYTRADRYAFDSNNIIVKLDANVGYTPDTYRVGDYIADFTILDIKGNSYGLYSLLKEKKVVVINFWFYGCSPCAAEFPALNAAYSEHKGNVEVLAVNDYPRETIEHVLGYEEYRGFKLDMPLFKTEYGSEVSLSRFPSNGYPTTVIIDRYGVISLVHVGYVSSVSAWNGLFEYYTSDSYNGDPYTDF